MTVLDITSSQLSTLELMGFDVENPRLISSVNEYKTAMSRFLRGGHQKSRGMFYFGPNTTFTIETAVLDTSLTYEQMTCLMPGEEGSSFYIVNGSSPKSTVVKLPRNYICSSAEKKFEGIEAHLTHRKDQVVSQGVKFTYLTIHPRGETVYPTFIPPKLE